MNENVVYTYALAEKTISMYNKHSRMQYQNAEQDKQCDQFLFAFKGD
ncbi:MAG: hypothetical protein ABFD91_13955 [Anaerohalosphaeraceae bacterium]